MPVVEAAAAERGDTLCLAIGGICVELRSLDPALTPGVPAAVEPFLAHGGDALATVTVRLGDLSDPPPGTRVFDSDGLWRLYREGDDYVFRFTSAALGRHPYTQARFTSDFRTGEVTLHAAYCDLRRPVNALEYPLDEILFTNLLARGLGIELHAVGVRDRDGHGYLFAGFSGAGKTTTARLWDGAGALVLSDDRIILRVQEGRLWMYGTPWHGEAEFAVAARTELHRIFVIGHGPRDDVVPLAPHAAVSELFARSFVPFYHVEALAHSLEMLERVSQCVPCAQFRFVPTPRAVDLVRAVC